MKLSLVFTSLVIVLLLGTQTALVRGEAPNLAPTLQVVFVGNENVDLLWDDVSTLGYQVKRDGIVLSSGSIETLPSGQKFYRDSTAVKSVTYEYEVCALTTGAPECSGTREAVVGEVKGSLFKNLTWDHGSYDVWGDITIQTGVTLQVNGNTSVSNAFLQPTILADPGILEIGGSAAAMPHFTDIHLKINNPASSIGYLNLTRGQIEADTGLNIHHSTLGGTSCFVLLWYGLSTLSHNTIACDVFLRDSANVTFTDNTISGDITLSEGARATLTDNTLTGYTSMRAVNSNLTLTHNTLAAVRIDYNRGSTLTVENNTFTRPPGGYEMAVSAGDYDPLLVSADRPSSPAMVSLSDNVFTGYATAILLSANVQFEIVGNTIAMNGTGIYGVGANGMLQNNCIAGNTTAGLHWEQNTVTATQNWWGHPNGPSFPLKPDLYGDLITTKEPGNVLWSGYLTADNCSESVRNLTIAHMEATQVIQNLGNTVDLVSGKKTRVRVYPASAPGTVPNVSADLILTQGSRTKILNSSNRVDPKTRINFNGSFTFDETLRGNQWSSIDFDLPTDWLTGTVTLSAELNPDHTIKERNYNDNSAEIVVTFDPPAPPLKVGVVPVNYSGGNLPDAIASAPDPQQMLEAFGILGQIYPGAELEPVLLPGINWSLTMKKPDGTFNQNERRYGKQILNKLRLRYLLEQASNPGDAPPGQLFAMFPAGALDYGMAEPPTQNAGLSRMSYGMLCPACLAHEVADNLGYAGVFPTTNEYGYDLLKGEPVPPTAYDISYWDNGYPPVPLTATVWIGPQNYQALLANSQTARPAMRTPEVQKYAIASGIIYKEWSFTQNDWVTKVTFDPSWEVTTAAVLENPPAGADYCLDLLASGGVVLSSYCFNQPSIRPETQYVDSFAVSLPFSGTPVRLSLRTATALGPTSPEIEIGSQSISMNPPQVTLTSPNGGEVLGASAQVQWSASDLDPSDWGKLTFSLLYSPDNGGSWQTVATGLTGSQATLDLSLVPGSTGARLRVIASDGFHTGQDDSDGTFTVSDKAPMVKITTPPASYTVYTTGVASLAGTAYDADDGLLEGAALTWTSSKDGLLGAGSHLEAVTLSPGLHWITLTAIDSAAHSASATVMVYSGEAKLIYLPVVLKR